MNISTHPLVTSPVAGDPESKAALQHRKLVDAAQQFEGMLLQEMLRPMKEHGFDQGSDDDSGDSNTGSGFSDTLSSFGSETLATAIARGGGLGIAKRVVEQVEGEKSVRAHIPTSKSAAQ